MILDYLGNAGFFLDIGANDPRLGSQSYALEQAGWSGICVEPQPRYAERLRKERKATVVQRACGGTDTIGKRLTLYALDINAALFPARVLYSNTSDIKETVEVELDTVDNILAEHSVTVLDFVSIDVEGYEMEVLSGFHLQKWQPKLVFIEDHLYNHVVHRHMTGLGFKLVRRTELNMWYVPDEAAYPVSIYGHWQLFRKLYLGHPFRLARRFAKRHLRK